jgi:hypothetical protein
MAGDQTLQDTDLNIQTMTRLGGSRLSSQLVQDEEVRRIAVQGQPGPKTKHYLRKTRHTQKKKKKKKVLRVTQLLESARP